MRLKGRYLVVIILILPLLFLNACTKKTGVKKNDNLAVRPGSIMILSSPVFEPSQYIPAKYSCDGVDVNPPLKIEGVPATAKSLVLVVDDPDAPNGDWVHWLVWNIKPTVKEIMENSLPSGAIQGLTSFGYNEWGGPCPPSGSHHYHFKLYALDTVLDLANTADKAALEEAMQGHILDKAELVGLYKRQ